MAQKKGKSAGAGSKNEGHLLTIQRSNWLRGEGWAKSYLLRVRDNKMCCLGFLGLSCGLSADEMEGEPSPKYINCDAGPWAWLVEEVVGGDDDGLKLTDDAKRAMNMNDFIINEIPAFSEADREAKITEVFADHGIQVVFA